MLSSHTSVSFLLFLPPFFPFPFLARRNVAPEIQLRDLGSSRQRGQGERREARPQTHFFGVFRAQGNVSGG